MFFLKRISRCASIFKVYIQFSILDTENRFTFMYLLERTLSLKIHIKFVVDIPKALGLKLVQGKHSVLHLLLLCDITFKRLLRSIARDKYFVILRIFLLSFLDLIKVIDFYVSERGK